MTNKAFGMFKMDFVHIHTCAFACWACVLCFTLSSVFHKTVLNMRETNCSWVICRCEECSLVYSSGPWSICLRLQVKVCSLREECMAVHSFSPHTERRKWLSWPRWPKVYKLSPLAWEETVCLPWTWKDRRGGAEVRMWEVKAALKEKMSGNEGVEVHSWKKRKS